MIKHIYSTDDSKNIKEIFKETYPEFQGEQLKKAQELIDFYTGDSQLSAIPDSERKYNVKTVVNYTQVFIDTVVSITLNKSIAYIARDDKYKEDVELISDFLKDANEHKYNLSTCNDVLVTGLGFQTCLETDDDEKPFVIDSFSPVDTYCVESQEAGHKVVCSFHINGDVVTAFDNKYKYRFKIDGDNDDVPFKIAVGDKIIEKNKVEHGLKNNPIQMFESNKYRLSVVYNLMGLQNSLNNGMSNYNNSILLFINQLLSIRGAELNAEDIKENLENNILLLPENGDAKFINAGINENIINYMEEVKENMCIISGCPSQKVGNAETGKGVETENGHTIANYNSNRRSTDFETSKREQLENVIEILKHKNLLKSDIRGKDVDIKFDRNRLLNITEHTNNLRTLLVDCKVPAYEALSVCDIFDDNSTVASGIEKNMEKENLLNGKDRIDKEI